MANRNITLSLPEDTLTEVKVLAARKHTSVSALLAEKLSELVEQADAYAEAKRVALALLESGLELNSDGELNWERSDLHER